MADVPRPDPPGRPRVAGGGLLPPAGPTSWAAPAPDPAAILPDVQPDDTAQIQYTSGTTGLPKGAMLHHRGLSTTPACPRPRLGLDPAAAGEPDAAVPHGRLRVSVLGAMPCWGEVLLPTSTRPDARAAGGRARRARQRANHADRRSRPPRLRPGRLTSIGAGRAAPSSRRAGPAGGEALGAPFIAVFGQTELAAAHHAGPDDSAEDRAGTLGRPLPRPRSRSSTPRPARGRARVRWASCTRGYHVMRGYLDDPERPRRSTPRAGCTPATSASMDGAATAASRAAEGHDHPGRGEHLPARDRGGCSRTRRSAKRWSSASRTRPGAR